jgi:hypothetical protein
MDQCLNSNQPDREYHKNWLAAEAPIVTHGCSKVG